MRDRRDDTPSPFPVVPAERPPSAPASRAHGAQELHIGGRPYVLIPKPDFERLLIEAELDTGARAAALTQHIPILELIPLPNSETGLFTLSGETGKAPVQSGPAETDDISMFLVTSGTTSRSKVIPVRQRVTGGRARIVAEQFEIIPR